MATKDESIRLSLIDGVTKNLDEIRKGVSGVGAELAKLNQVGELAGKAFDGLSSVGNFFGDLVNDAGAYEQKLLEVETRTHATAEESKLLREAIQQALQDTATGATAAADALRLMAEDGASATESAQNLSEVVAYAQANTRGLAETVQGLGAALDAFGEAPAKIGALADSLTATAIAAGTSTKAIEEGVARAGIAAEQANLSLDETVALIGALAERGLEGGRGGAALVKVLQELSDPASKAGEALRQAGINGGDLSGVMQKLATDAVLSEKVLSSLGDKPRAALKLLLADGGASLAGITKAIEESAGASQRASDQLGNGFALAQKRLAESLDNMKIALATPLLEPLAGAFEAFATRINTFAQSEQFKQIADEIARFVTAGLEEFAKFAEDFDLDAATAKIAEFASAFADNLSSVVEFANVAGAAVGTMYDVVKGGAAVLAEAFTGVASDIAGVAGLVSDDAAEISRMFADMSRNARGLSDDALADLSRRFGLTSQQATALATATRDAALSARVASGDFKALEQALPKSSIDATIERLSKFGLLLKKDTPEAAAAGAEGIKKVGDEAAATAANIERIKIGNLLKQMDDLFRSGQAGSDAYKALNAQFLAAEARLNELTGATDKAKQAQDELSGKTDKAAESFRNQASAARDAAGSMDNVASSNSAVSESFGNIARQSSSVAISLGNLSEAFVQQALAAAGASTSADGYRETWNAFIAESEQIEQRLANRIDLLNRMTAATDEESTLRAQLEQQYGTSSRRLEELVQLELKLAQARRERNQEAEREIEIEDRRQQQAGGIGTQGRATQADTVAATGGRGTAAGGGSRIEAPIAITVNGLPSDRETWRQLVAEVIVPEIKRIERLSR